MSFFTTLKQLGCDLIVIRQVFSDDPAAPVGLEEGHTSGDSEAGQGELREGQSEDVDSPLDPNKFCSCGLCTKMPTLAECFCCKSVNYLQAGGRDGFY